VLVLCCGPADAPERNPVSDDPASEFHALENRLLEARTVRVAFHVTAEGAVEADLRGDLEITPEGETRLTAAGRFAGQPAELLLRSDDGECEFGNASNRASVPRPDRLNESLLLGFTRMGILHNLARLAGGQPPDRADGGIREWVVADSFGRDPADSGTFSFEVLVAGERAASASLEIDPEGRPVVRRQTVRFPTGEMRVVERYPAVTIDP
jgi:hypothetical protein